MNTAGIGDEEGVKGTMSTWRAFLEGFANRMRSPNRPTERGEQEMAKDEGSEPEVIKEPPMEIDGRCMTAAEFVRYAEHLNFPSPRPTRIFLHHTWKPTRENWRGRDSIMALKRYYEGLPWQDEEGRLHEGWTAGPHLFIADDGIWLFTDLREDGVGVYGHNYRSRHIEMVGDYDHQRPYGPTLANTIAALGILHYRLGLDVQKLNFHRDFSTKSCPGHAVRKEWIIPQVAKWVEEYREAIEDALDAVRRSLVRMARQKQLLVPTNPETALAKAGVERGLLGAITNEFPMEIEDQGYVVQLFAEALLVPVHEWKKVQSLKEFERARLRPGEAEEPEGAERRPSGKDSFPPEDPFPFEGEIR